MLDNLGQYRNTNTVFNVGAEEDKRRERRTMRGMDEYRLLVQPGMDICALINEERRYLKDHFPEAGFSFVPEIALGLFWANEMMEDTLIRWIGKACLRMSAFEVLLNNYSAIPGQSIYLRIQDHQPFKVMMKQLDVIDQYLQSGGSDGVKWNTNPVMNISATLSKDQYNQAIIEYASREFHTHFTVNELILLKSRNRTEKTKLVTRFQLLTKN